MEDEDWKDERFSLLLANSEKLLDSNVGRKIQWYSSQKEPHKNLVPTKSSFKYC